MEEKDKTGSDKSLDGVHGLALRATHKEMEFNCQT